MNAYWRLNTHGDPLTSLSEFIQKLWNSEDLDLMVVSPDGHGYLLQGVEEVLLVNPFHPMMKVNLARVLIEVVKQNPGKRIGAVLRACELRALNELVLRGAIKHDHILTICVDCLGTYPVEEMKWRAERLALAQDIASETLRFAPQGGIAMYRYRPACQICANPGATEGMINIGVLGLSVRNEMLVNVTVENMDLTPITQGTADEKMILRREKMLARIIERQSHTRAMMIETLDSSMPEDLDSLIDLLHTCGQCQVCLDVCPIGSFDHPQKAADGRLNREDVLSWLASCAGCGMCEQACPQKLPLVTIFNHIRDQQKIIN